MTRLLALLLGALALQACIFDFDVLRRGRGERDAGSDASSVDAAQLPHDAGLDAWSAVDGGAECQRGVVTCDDGQYCNGVETCMPGGTSDVHGCVAGTAPCATGGMTCNETTDHCVAACMDMDGDHHPAMSCGGDDCDDNDAMRFPGNTEVCDVGNRDEDCNCLTYGTRDVDGDGYTDWACCNCVGTGFEHCGTDCNDGDRTIHPGAPDPAGGVDANCDGVP